ncbi:hypothetical protein E3P77_00042 [Wallemia ichthyophaga]|nr:hypothetical protein E3P91_00042 [Wallemia ichthyophaga]TIA84283.1 hypothetical protein E3P98_00254 [Wallemia ichthyophaga]TIA94360.1 hypothetical protein E3P97_00042 [Wallemia ichthyophaga]TIB03509.1 hypothetical protein E3P96_01863 [Wallemia ichthyophaga]TIB36176.1 hypothetical protein E3P85_00126 [Wallemia ichthyophaga]
MYAKLDDRKTCAFRDAREQETEIYESTQTNTYKSATANTLIKLKRRAPITDSTSPVIGTENTIRKRLEEAERSQSTTLTRSNLKKYIPTPAQLQEYGYVVDIPNTLGGSEPSAVGQMKDCSRCNQKYIVEDGDLLKDDCKFHDGKAITTKVDGRRSRIMSCCSTQMGSSGCCTGPHVFLEKDAESLNKRAGFIHTPLRSDSLDVVALDCEMSFTTSGMSLTRLTVVNSDAEVILDELIKPHSKIIDANTRFSGVTIKQIEESAVFDLVGIRSVLFEIGVGSDTIIVGHGLENDLNALRIVHSNILDTAILYPHPAGLPFRNSLRNLAADVLKKFIQDAAPSSGTVVATHSSLEDASTTLDFLFESCYYSPELLSSDKVALVKNLIVENDPSLDTLLETLPRFNHLNSITLSPTLATLIFEDPALDSTMALQKACPSLRQVTFAGDQVFKIVNQPSGIEFFKTKISDCNDVNLCSSCDCSPNRYQPKLMLRKRRTLRVAY